MKASAHPVALGVVHGYMFISTALVATSFTVGKAITPFLDPVVLTFIRFVLAALLFAPYVSHRFGLRRPDRSAIVRYSLISGSLAGFFWLMFLSLQMTTPLNTGAIFTTVPGIAGICSWLLLKERLGMYRIAALLLAMIGALWVIFEGDPAQVRQMAFNRGDLLFFCGCLLMALYIPLVKLFHRGEPMAVMTWWILITGCGWLLLFSLTKLPGIPWQTVPATVWFGIGYLAFFTTIVTFFIAQWSSLHLGPTRVAAYSYLYPPLIVLIEWCVHQTLPSLHTMLGIAIILPAMLIVQKKEAARP
ncbi:MAG: DMT family transporter [Desulfobulbus sp.]|nr:DMT family transporter [Desulfobulbus sp.]